MKFYFSSHNKAQFSTATGHEGNLIQFTGRVWTGFIKTRTGIQKSRWPHLDGNKEINVREISDF